MLSIYLFVKPLYVTRRLSHHFDGLFEPVLVVLGGEAVRKDPRALVFPQQQQAAFIGDDVRRPVQHPLQQQQQQQQHDQTTDAVQCRQLISPPVYIETAESESKMYRVP